MSVKLRLKKLKDGKQSAWLDIYHRGQRKAEFLGIVLTGNRATDKEMLKVANDCLSSKSFAQSGL